MTLPITITIDAGLVRDIEAYKSARVHARQCALAIAANDEHATAWAAANDAEEAAALNLARAVMSRVEGA